MENNEYVNDSIKDEKNNDNMSKELLKCPICNEYLTFLMPTGGTLYCKKCDKYFKNDDGKVGAETTSPYTRNDVFY